MNSPKPPNKFAKPFRFLEKDMREAMDANADIGHVFTEQEIRSNWTLARCLLVAGMRADGASRRQIAERFGFHKDNTGQIIHALRWRIMRKLHQTELAEKYSSLRRLTPPRHGVSCRHVKRL